MSYEKRFQRKQGLLNRILSSINFLVTEDSGTRDLRSSARIDCRAEVAYVDEKGVAGEGFLVDISRTGLQIETEKKLPKGYTLALNPPNDDKVGEKPPFMARVRWTRKIEGGKFRAGLGLPPSVVEDEHWLEALLDHLGYNDAEKAGEELDEESLEDDDSEDELE